MGWRPTLLALLLAGPLVGLAVLQYRWTGELSRAEEERTRAGLVASAAAFAEDVDREVMRLVFQVAGPPMVHGEPQLPARVAAWRALAPHPRLLRQAFAVRVGGDPDALLAVDEATGELRPAAWPPALAPLRALLVPGPAAPPSAAKEVPALLVPLPDEGMHRHGDEAPAGPRLRSPLGPRWGEGGGQSTELAMAILWLDERSLREELLGELVARHFGGGESRYRVEIRDESGALVLARGEAVPGGRPEATVPLLVGWGPEHGMRKRSAGEGPAMMLRRRAPSAGAAADAADDGGAAGAATGHRLLAEELHDAAREGVTIRQRSPSGGGDGERAGMGMLPRRHGLFLGIGPWTLTVTHPAGSLAAAAAHARWRDLALSSAVLLLLAVSVALVVEGARRSQALARRQIELVAGVTHELLTPLAALRSAGENLAAGVIAEPAQVRRYGELIVREGRRLSGLVEQALTWSGLQVRGLSFAGEPVDLAALVAEAAHEAERAAREAGVALETQVEPGLPPVRGDRTTLGRLLRNLLENALKHGRTGGWVGVGARRASTAFELWVEDRGPGVDREELPHLFEPFFRGHAAVRGAVAGSGLGLALVRQIAEAHGGSARVESGAQGGARFVVTLPGAAGEPV